MIISIDARHTDGRDYWFHIKSESLTLEQEKDLATCKATGKIKQSFLDTLQTLKTYYSSIIEDHVEVDIID